MLEYETYLEKKWLERHGIREDKVHLREEDCRVKDKSRREHCSCKGVRLKWGCLWRAVLGFRDTVGNLTTYNNTGDNMDKWKDLPKRKKFLYAVGVLVVIALVGWWTGWWASPEVVV